MILSANQYAMVDAALNAEVWPGMTTDPVVNCMVDNHLGISKPWDEISNKERLAYAVEAHEFKLAGGVHLPRVLHDAEEALNVSEIAA